MRAETAIAAILVALVVGLAVGYLVARWLPPDDDEVDEADEDDELLAEILAVMAARLDGHLSGAAAEDVPVIMVRENDGATVFCSPRSVQHYEEEGYRRLGSGEGLDLGRGQEP